MHIVRLMNNLVKRSKKNDDKSAVAMLNKYELHDRTGKPVVCRDTSHERHGPVVYNSSNTRQLGCVFQDMKPPRSILRKSADTQKPIRCVFNSLKPLHVTLKFETKILRSDIFAQVNLMSVAPTLQNLRIGLRKRLSGKSKVPAKRRGSWPKMC